MFTMEEMLLGNGVRLIIEDRTKVLTGDLYMVHFVFTTVVDLDKEDAELRGFCGGDQATMSRELQKPAVHERDLEKVRISMKESYLETNLPYLERAKFPKRFKAKLLKDFREAEEKKNRSHG